MTKTPQELYNEDPYGYYMSQAAREGIQLTLAFTQAASAAQDDKGENLVISPFNALQCLAMVANGSAGNTRDELAKTLFATDAANLDGKLADFGQLVKDVLLANKDSVTLTTAYATWANSEQVALRQDFVDRLAAMGSDVNAVPFSDPSVVDAINQWCSDNTAGNIDEIIKELSPDDLAILASALYFKGDWTEPFDASLTKEKTFTDANGDAYTTAMMHMDSDPAEEQEFSYLEGNDYEALSLTYGKTDYEAGKQPTMRLVLVRPTDENVSARDWFASQTGTGKTPAWLSDRFGAAVGSIELPKMDIDQEHDLVPVLESLGVKDMFDFNADLTPMVVYGRPYVSEVKQKVVFKSDEKGSEAAAVTYARVSLECMKPQPKQIDLKFDRSYVFALQDIKSKAVLFTGIVNKPNKAMKPV